MKRTDPRVDAFIKRGGQWQKEYARLRTIILSCGLTEELKWGVPCYTSEKKNVVLMHGFNDYCALLFPKGALLKDTRHVLVTQTENVQGARQVRFTTVAEVVKLAPILKDLIQQATEVEKAGLKVALKAPSEYAVPAEFKHKLDETPALKAAFEALTPGRQRAYLLYFAAPKLPKTREARVEKCAPQILKGKGLND